MTKQYQRYQIENVMGGACSTHGIRKCIRIFGRKISIMWLSQFLVTLTQSTRLQDLRM